MYPKPLLMTARPESSDYEKKKSGCGGCLCDPCRLLRDYHLHYVALSAMGNSSGVEASVMSLDRGRLGLL